MTVVTLERPWTPYEWNGQALFVGELESLSNNSLALQLASEAGGLHAPDEEWNGLSHAHSPILRKPAYTCPRVLLSANIGIARGFSFQSVTLGVQ